MFEDGKAENVLEEFKGYLDTRGMRPSTRRAYFSDIRCLLNGSLAEPSTILNGDYKLLVRYIDLKISSPLDESESPATRVRRAVAARVFVQFLHDRGYVDSAQDMRAPVTDLGYKNIQIEPITEGQFQQLMGGISSQGNYRHTRTRAVLRLMMDTGISTEEVSRLLYDDFLNAESRKTGVSVGQKEKRALEITEATCSELDIYEKLFLAENNEEVSRDKTKPYFRNNRGDGISGRSIRRDFGLGLSYAGLLEMDTRTLRYAFARRKLEEGARTEELAKALGIHVDNAKIIEKRLRLGN